MIRDLSETLLCFVWCCRITCQYLGASWNTRMRTLSHIYGV